MITTTHTTRNRVTKSDRHTLRLAKLKELVKSKIDVQVYSELKASLDLAYKNLVEKTKMGNSHLDRYTAFENYCYYLTKVDNQIRFHGGLTGIKALPEPIERCIINLKGQVNETYYRNVRDFILELFEMDTPEDIYLLKKSAGEQAIKSCHGQLNKENLGASRYEGLIELVTN
ncbi:hypothetical protein Molly5_29 [Maribacter phage Molly_5]|uniref:Uncharacterized protein n=1 Tax=Maribacter phage Molly_1 TaxID=2745685 RepID=A0A8E4UYF6_9CAUD|nr:hypothetical protein M1M29_gp029 [Maribacter phage Molly_1]QQO97710.1 hypothetical protein Molly2_29 [Maribacter phage Molly_2]QQO97910.1 hypothetical protein Molly3_29 [Maribacter phage Molly_3]QQO98110.1 hypothetical protein Molly4_29 [Maribacter phage Molly_4]QQO98310.1 hypothetical protein Molly5_29 [Maribacter phage Molly_5]QQO97510.1 hypothetical protein Molly1_29 [Maribacter phage Molly_1]